MLCTIKTPNWLTWIMACSFGELLGIAVSAGLEFAFWKVSGQTLLGFHGLLTLLVGIGLGGLEGLIIGYFQWCVLVGYYPQLQQKRWLYLTAGAGATGWLIGTLPSVMLASSIQAWLQSSAALIPLLAILAGSVFGALFGLYQWWELKLHAQHSPLWILANALAWPLAVGLFYWGFSMIQTGITPILIFGLGSLIGFSSGIVLGIVTGLFLFWIKPLQSNEHFMSTK